MRLRCRPLPAVLSIALGACGTAPPPAAPPQEARPGTAANAATNCNRLAQAVLPGVRVTRAVLVAANAQRARDPGSDREVGEPLPEHCWLQGRIDEHTGADGKPYASGFELRLPTQWNGRLVYQGGDDGVPGDAVGRNTGARGWADHGLGRGFAAVSTDAGHPDAGPAVGLDPQARTEHAYRAHEHTARTAQALLALYYGRAADRSYFVGCSGGGRQGLMFAQRHAELFDGVVAVAPALRVSEGATIAAAWTVRKFSAVAPGGVLAKALGDAQLRRVAAEILDRCDATDGLKDGLVNDTAGCRIDVQALVCPRGGDGCLSPAQAQALADVMAGPRNAVGPLYVPWPWDPGIADPGWRAWTLGQAMLTPPDPSLSLPDFDFERDPPRLAASRRVGAADDVDLAGFRQRKGKLLMFHGMADPVFSALATADYQRRLNARHADAASWSRSFLVPGMTHCAGGPATDDFDGLAAIVDWVERGRAPERIVARGTQALPGVGRPLCPYPKMARYTGGDEKSAASFECR